MKGVELMIVKSKPYIDSLYTELKQEVALCKHRPQLVIIQVGDDAASTVYVNQKLKRAEEIGVSARHLHFGGDMTENELIETLHELNQDNDVTGYIVQLPLPSHIQLDNIVMHIDPLKDADGFHPYNIGMLTLGNKAIQPCTPKGIVWLLEQVGVPIAGANVVVIGRSNLVGKPLSLLLMEKDATVMTCHSKTIHLKSHLKTADIIIAAAGVPHLVQQDMVKQGAVVIDVGIHRQPDGSLCGDVDFINVSERASIITPVPGGVGPVTVAMLLKNIVEMAQSRK